MPKDGFTRDAKVIAGILHNDPGGIAAVDAAAEDLLAKSDDPEAFLSDPYHTDRYVRALVVPKDNQMKRGSATRAAAKTGTKITWTYLASGETGKAEF